MMIRVCLEQVLAEKGMTRYELAKKAGITYPVIDKYYKNKVSRYDRTVLARICQVLDCEVGDILALTKES